MEMIGQLHASAALKELPDRRLVGLRMLWRRDKVSVAYGNEIPFIRLRFLVTAVTELPRFQSGAIK
jgi:hypothetical protein